MKRWTRLDQARGLAVLFMIGFHFCFDLDQIYGLIDIDIKTDLFWTTLRNIILSSFLFIAGISLYPAANTCRSFSSHLKNQQWLAVCALLVSMGTYPVFPHSWIYFGVLHCILLARILCYFCPRLVFFNLWAGLVILGAGLLVEHSFFDPKWINWIGFATYKPLTEDYVPLFPWLGVFMFGIFFGRWVFSFVDQSSKSYDRPKSCLGQGLAFTGRHSLLIYMLHQPLLLGILAVVVYVLDL